MKIVRKLVAATALASATLFAGGASAQTYNLNFGSSLTGQITTVASTGSSKVITGITGTYMGQTITGLNSNPFSPAVADYDQVTGVKTLDSTTMTHANDYYSYDNVLQAGNVFDVYGLLFETATSDVNLYSDAGGFELISSPIGQNSLGTGGVVTGTITQAAAAVPESATWAMMILGMGAVGFAMRRRQKVTTRVSYAA